MHTGFSLKLRFSRMITDPNALTRQQIKAAFRRHHGEASRLARGLGISPQNISDYMRGRGKSQRVESAVRLRAAELIDAEQGQKRNGGSL